MHGADPTCAASPSIAEAMPAGESATTRLFYSNVTCMGEKSWAWITSQTKTYDFFAIAETHVHSESALRSYDSKAR
eukprot:3117479-Pyramimonas_sp.AAC.1